jgi:peptidoglycan/xylan/chitin deacetylase (PgdA/CDA1 family)
MSRRGLILAIIALLGVVTCLGGLRQLARSHTVQLFGRLVACDDTPERVVALTFDDGPTSERVDEILRVLAARGVHATFFVIGSELAAAPEAGRRLVAAGHERGNHRRSSEPTP